MKRLIAAILMIALPTSAFAGDKVAVRPIQVGEQTARYNRGVATVEMATSDATIDITPLGFDHGGLSFGVAVFNASNKSANIDVTDISASIGEEALSVLTADELVKKAKNRAMWAAIAVGLAAGLGAAAASSQRDYYRGSMSTPRGTYSWTYSAPSVGGQVAAAGFIAGGAYGMTQIQSQLDATVAGIGNNALQMTTVGPGESYAGKIVLTRAKAKNWPQVLHLVIRWNGRTYPFDFDIGSGKRPAPVFADVAVPTAIGEPAVGSLPPPAPVLAGPAPITPVIADAPKGQGIEPTGALNQKH